MIRRAVKNIMLLATLLAFMVLQTSFYKRAQNVPDKSSRVLSVPSVDSLVIPKNYFINPLDLPMTIVGNFGEPRKAHYHTGLDFRTNQEEGHKVFAAAVGYVSRINVSGGGYGKALYITHPNGFVTVYAHLKDFAPKIKARLKAEQYKRESFSVDFKPKPDELPVTQGELIALSGNTGGSGGPHLHFEIRDTLERVYNPMLFDYKLKDNQRPVVNYVKFYPADELKYKCDGYRLKVSGSNGLYVYTPILKFNTKQLGFSVNTFDRIEGSGASIGIYNLTVFDGKKMVYNYKIDRITFAEKRYVMSHVDYPIFMNEGRKSFHKCFVEPGNVCPVYDNVVNAGIIDLSDKKQHEILIEISDFAGNVSTVKFTAQYDAAGTLFKEKDFRYTQLFEYNHANEFATSDFRISVPERCLFDNIYFSYSSSPAASATVFSKLHQAGNSNDVTYDYFDVSLKAENISPALLTKALVVHKDKNGSASAKGGREENGWITAKAREFGQFYITIDTTAPTIRALNITTGRNMKPYGKLLFKLSDNLSGLSDFDTYLNNQWVVAEYDAKSATLTYTPESISNGTHNFKVTAVDERGNSTTLEMNFIWQ